MEASDPIPEGASGRSSTGASVVVPTHSIESRDIAILSLSFCMAVSCSNVLLIVGPLCAKNASIGIVLVGFYALGISCMAALSSFAIKRFGKSLFFCGGSLCYMIGGFLGLDTTLRGDHSTFMIIASAFFIGLGQGCANFYRFAAAELYGRGNDAKKSIALSYVLAGGIGASLVHLLLLLIEETSLYWAPIPVFSFVGMCLHLMVSFPSNSRSMQEQMDDAEMEGNPVTIIMNSEHRGQILFGIAVSTMSVFIVIMLMATISSELRDFHQCGFAVITIVYSIHYVGMYAPGVFAGHIIAKWGIIITVTMCVIGAFTGLTLIYLFNERSDGVPAITVGFFVGGTVFSTGFSSGSICVQKSLRSSEMELNPARFQGIHDGIVYVFAGVASITASILYDVTGFNSVLELGYSVAGAFAIIVVLAYTLGWAEFFVPALRPSSVSFLGRPLSGRGIGIPAGEISLAPATKTATTSPLQSPA